MEHIKTPVRYDPSRGDTIKDAKHRLIAVLPEGAVECASELVLAVNAYDRLLQNNNALVAAAAGLYDTVQDLRHVINGVLRDDDSGPVLDDVMSRGRKHIKAYHAALALVKGDQKSDDATA